MHDPLLGIVSPLSPVFISGISPTSSLLPRSQLRRALWFSRRTQTGVTQYRNVARAAHRISGWELEGVGPLRPAPAGAAPAFPLPPTGGTPGGTASCGGQQGSERERQLEQQVQHLMRQQEQRHQRTVASTAHSPSRHHQPTAPQAKKARVDAGAGALPPEDPLDRDQHSPLHLPFNPVRFPPIPTCLQIFSSRLMSTTLACLRTRGCCAATTAWVGREHAAARCCHCCHWSRAVQGGGGGGLRIRD